MKKSVLIILALLIITAVIVAIALKKGPATFAPNAISAENKKTQDKFEEERNNKESLQQSEKEDTKVENPEVSGSSKGNSGTSSQGNSPSESSTETSSECLERKISYSLKDFNTTSVCNFYENGNCSDKTVSCSATIENLDDNTSGNFVLNIKFYDADIGEHAQLTANIEEVYVPAGADSQAQSSIQLAGEDAEKNVGCTFTTLEVPEEIIC